MKLDSLERELDQQLEDKVMAFLSSSETGTRDLSILRAQSRIAPYGRARLDRVLRRLARAGKIRMGKRPSQRGRENQRIEYNIFGTGQLCEREKSAVETIRTVSKI